MKITSSEFILSGTNLTHLPTTGFPEIMLCGRSNVGKSTFINMFLNNKKMARTSQTPGKTQTLNYFLVNENFYLVDVPGYGYAKISETKRATFGEMMESYLSSRKELVMVLQLIDFRHKPTADDVQMAEFIRYHQIPLGFIATKLDKVKRSLYHKNKKLIEETLGITNEPFIITSSETRAGLEEIYSLFEEQLKKQNQE